MIRAAVIALAVAWTTPAAAQDPAARAEFDSAVEQMMDGDGATAATQLERIAAEYAGDDVADDALFHAAELLEQQLRDPRRAVELYEQLVRDYPDSRLSSAATERAAELGRLRGDGDSGDAALAEFLAIKNARAELGAQQAMARAEALLAAHPDWPGAGAVALWLGGEYERATRWADAAAAYDRAASARDSDVAFAGAISRARLATHRGDFERAATILDGLDPAGSPDRARSVRDARETLSQARRRSSVSAVAIAVLVLGIAVLVGSLRVGAGSWHRAARALSRPPTEALYLLPVCALLVAVAATGFPDIASAVAAICGGGLAVTWLSGCGLRARSASRASIAVHAAAAAGAIGSICYIALYRAQLLDLIARTVVFGPDV